MIELLSEHIHNLWMGWAQSIMKSEMLSEERLTRWMSLMVPYDSLPEEEKDKDRLIAENILNLIQEETK